MSSLWYDNAEIVATLAAAEEKGWVRRISVTQIEWTEEGVRVAETSPSPVKSIWVNQVEGEVDSMIDEVVESFEAADALLRLVSAGCSGLGYRKVEVTVSWENGEELKQRHDVTRCSGDTSLADIEVASHSRRLLATFIRETEIFDKEICETAKRIKETCSLLTNFERRQKEEDSWSKRAYAGWK